MFPENFWGVPKIPTYPSGLGLDLHKGDQILMGEFKKRKPPAQGAGGVWRGLVGGVIRRPRLP